MAVFTNRATLTYTGGTVNSNIVTGELTTPLTVTKTSLSETYRTGDTVTYLINLTNAGTVPLTGLTLSDDLGAYAFGTGTSVPLEYAEGSVRYFVNGVLQTAPTVTAGAPTTFSGITVPAGGNAQLIYRTTVNAFAPLGADGTIRNTVSVTGGGLTAPVTAENTVTASTAPELSVVKAATPLTVSAGETLTYTFTVYNYGPTEADAAQNVVITDTFDPILQDIAVTYNGTVWTAGNEYTYNETTGLFSSTAGAVTVPAATYTLDAATGRYVTVPGSVTLVISGRV